MSMIKQRLAQRETRCQCVEGSMMLADDLTKRDARGHVDLFRQLMGTCRYCIRLAHMRCLKKADLLEIGSRWDRLDRMQQLLVCEAAA